MGALIGGGIGALLGIAGGYERARAIKRAQSDQAFLDLALKNPSVFAGDEKLLGEVKKRTSPEFADLLGGIGKHAAQFQQQVQGAMGGGASQQGGQPSPAGQMVAGPGAPPAPNAQQDPMQAHIAQLDSQINKLESIMLSPGASDPSNAPVVEHLKTLVSDLRQQRTQLTSEKYGQERQERQFSQQEKMESQRESAAESREAAREGAADRREMMREDFRDHLENLKEAKTEAQKKRAFTTTLAGLSKTRSQIEARANKAPDQATRQAEVDTFNSGLDALKLSIDDPDQVKQLDALRLDVGEAKPKYMGLSETPGTVGPESPPAKSTFKAGDRRTKDGVTYERNEAGEWHPVKS